MKRTTTPAMNNSEFKVAFPVEIRAEGQNALILQDRNGQEICRVVNQDVFEITDTDKEKADYLCAAINNQGEK